MTFPCFIFKLFSVPYSLSLSLSKTTDSGQIIFLVKWSVRYIERHDLTYALIINTEPRIRVIDEKKNKFKIGTLNCYTAISYHLKFILLYKDLLDSKQNVESILAKLEETEEALEVSKEINNNLADKYDKTLEEMKHRLSDRETAIETLKKRADQADLFEKRLEIEEENYQEMEKEYLKEIEELKEYHLEELNKRANEISEFKQKESQLSQKIKEISANLNTVTNEAKQESQNKEYLECEIQFKQNSIDKLSDQLEKLTEERDSLKLKIAQVNVELENIKASKKETSSISDLHSVGSNALGSTAVGSAAVGSIASGFNASVSIQIDETEEEEVVAVKPKKVSRTASLKSKLISKKKLSVSFN